MLVAKPTANAKATRRHSHSPHCLSLDSSPAAAAITLLLGTPREAAYGLGDVGAAQFCNGAVLKRWHKGELGEIIAGGQ